MCYGLLPLHGVALAIVGIAEPTLEGASEAPDDAFRSNINDDAVPRLAKSDAAAVEDREAERMTNAKAAKINAPGKPITNRLNLAARKSYARRRQSTRRPAKTQSPSLLRGNRCSVAGAVNALSTERMSDGSDGSAPIDRIARDTGKYLLPVTPVTLSGLSHWRSLPNADAGESTAGVTALGLVTTSL